MTPLDVNETDVYPSDDDPVVLRLTDQMDVAATRLAVPGDGRAVVAGQVRRHRRGRQVRACMGGVLAAVLLIAGISYVGTRSDEEGAPVYAGPVSEAEAGESPIAPLAPTGIDWAVTTYVPRGFNTLGGTPAPGYPDPMSMAYGSVSFESGGYDWNLMIRAGEPDMGWGGQTQPLSYTIDDRMVHLAVDETQPDRVHEAMWADPSGDTVLLVGRASGAILPVGEAAPDASETSSTTMPDTGVSGDAPITAEEMSVDLQPTVDDVLAVVPLIQPVDAATWKAAIAPPVGAADPRSGSTAQPLRLGLVADPSATQIHLKPWSNSASILDVEGYPAGSFRLNVDLPDSALATDPASLEGAEVEDVQVRGVTGQFVAGPYWPGDSLAGRSRIVALGGQESTADGGGSTGYGKVLAWDEGGSQVQLELADDLSVDDALHVANGLMELNDTQWDALLFPAREPSTSSTTTMAIDENPTPLEPLSSIDEYAARCEGPDAPRWMIFLDPEATSDQIAAVRGAVADAPGVEQTQYLDQAAAYEEFKQLFADKPELVDTVTPEILPSSYRIWAGPEWESPADVPDMAGVRGTVTCN